MAKMQMTATPSIISRIACVARTEGARGLARRVSERVIHGFGLLYLLILYYPLSPDMPEPVKKADFDVEVLDPQDLNAVREMTAMYELQTTEDFMLQRLAGPELVTVARVDGKIVGYLWFRLEGEIREFGRALITLKPDEIYCHDAYVLPDQRGKAIYPYMKAAGGRLLAQQYGKRLMLSYVLPGNAKSRQASKKVGEGYAGYVGYVTIFGTRLPFLWWREKKRT